MISTTHHQALAQQLSGANGSAQSQLSNASLSVVSCPRGRVTPVLTLSGNRVLRNPDGSPADAVTLTLGIQKNPANLAYNGNARLRRSNQRVEVHDRRGTAGFGQRDEIVLSAQDLANGPVSIQVRGLQDGASRLSWSLDDPHDPHLIVDPPVTGDITVESINELTPTLQLDSQTLWFDASGKKKHKVKAKLSVAQTNNTIAYQSAIKLTRSAGGVGIHTDAQCSGQEGFGDIKKSIVLNTQELLTAQRTAYLTATATGNVSLTLSLDNPNDARIRVGAPSTQNLAIRAVNAVNVHLDVEYKVVPLARDLARYQALTETPHTTGLVAAEVWIDQSDSNIGYTGSVRVRRSNRNVLAYGNANGSGNELFGNNKDYFDIANVNIATGQHVRFYLKGVTAGSFDLTTGLEVLNRDDVVEGDAVRQAMSVVELALQLHRDAASPAPGAMSDQYKVQTGRFLHVQNNQGHFGRAKLVIVKPSDHVWNVGDNDYELLVSADTTSGGVELYDHPQNGAIGNGRPLPVRLRQQDFQNGNVELWVQGAAHCNAARDIKLDVGLDRPVRGMNKAVKRNGDWARLTVVQITQVTPTADNYRQYINLPAASGHPELGRAYHAEARITPALQNVNVLFKLIPNANNKANLPVAQRHQDPNTPVTSATDQHGLAAADLTLARYGGDIFQVGAYLEEDATAGAAHPVSGKPITVWRKIFYALGYMNRPGGGNYGNRADEARFRQEYARCFVELERAGNPGGLNFQRDVHFQGAAAWAASHFTGTLPARTTAFGFIDSLLSAAQTHNVQLPAEAGNQIIQSNTTQSLWIDRSNQAAWLVGPHRYRTSANAWQPLAPNRVQQQSTSSNCQIAVDLTGISGTVNVELVFLATDISTSTVVRQIRTSNGLAGGSVVRSSVLPNHVINGGNWLVSAKYSSNQPGNWQQIPTNRINMAAVGDNYRLELDFQGHHGTFDIEVGIRAHNWREFFGGAYNNAVTLVAVRTIEDGMPQHAADTALQIMLHEVGHYLGLGSQLLFDGSNNTHYYNNPGIGNHCNRGPDTCVMRHAPVASLAPNLRFCATCEEILRARDMSNPPNSTVTAFPA
jgi:hypothetical protein